MPTTTYNVDIKYANNSIANYNEGTRVTLKNLLDTSKFSLSNVSVSGSIYTFATGTTAMINQSLDTPIVGHKYYGRVWQKCPSGSSYPDGRFEYYVSDGSGGLMIFAEAKKTTMDNNWHLDSAIKSLSSLASSSGWKLRSFTVNGNNAFQRKEMMIIDLTLAFGSGNEPSKEWCDAYIPYFYDTLNMIVVKNGSGHLTGVPCNGTARTLNTANKITPNNIKVGSKTLQCANKMMSGDVKITASAPVTTYKWWRYSIASAITGYSVYSVGATGSKTYYNDNTKMMYSAPSISNGVFDMSSGESVIVSQGSTPAGRYCAANADSIKTGGETSYPSYYAYVTSCTDKSVFGQRIYSTATADIYGIQANYVYGVGSYIDEVTSTNPYAYPVNGISGSYWYTSQETFPSTDYNIGFFMDNTGLTKGGLESVSGYSVTNYIKLPDGCTSVKVKGGATRSNGLIMNEYDAGGTYLSYWGHGSDPREFNLDYPSACKYVRLELGTSQKANAYVYDKTHGLFAFRGPNVTGI